MLGIARRPRARLDQVLAIHCRRPRRRAASPDRCLLVETQPEERSWPDSQLGRRELLAVVQLV